MSLFILNYRDEGDFTVPSVYKLSQVNNKQQMKHNRTNKFTLNGADKVHFTVIYLPKVNNRNTRTRCEICSKLTIKTPQRCHWRRSGVLIVDFEHISHLVLVFLLLL